MTMLDDRLIEREEIRPHRGFDVSPFLAVILLTALAITMAGVFPFRQMLAQGRQVEQTRLQYETIANENQRLEEQIVVLNTPLEIERIAREQYGLVRPGETALRAVPSGEVPTGVGVTPDIVEDKPWYSKFWDFLTGRDLVPDAPPSS